MQMFPGLRRLAALFSLFALGLLVPLRDATARTQEANLISTAVFGVSTITNPPGGVRGDLLLANDGNIYFASSGGGLGYGAIGKLAPDGTLSVLYAMQNGNEGASPYAGLVQHSDGNLYGTTYLGGTESGGVVFKVTLAGQFTVLRSLGQTRRDAVLPYTGLVEGPDGHLYGTTLRGGDNDRGTVFRISTTGDFSILHHFNGADGENPEGTLIVGADGNLYGTTLGGGAENRGTIYRIGTSGSHTLVYSFPALGAFNTSGLATNAIGANPRAGLLLAADGNYYGTAYQGGSNGFGTVFRMTPAGSVSVVHHFTGPSFGGSFPLSRVSQDAAGNLYGTTQSGGYTNKGTVWRIDTQGQFRVLHGFVDQGIDGAAPYATVLPANGTLYAVSSSDQLYSAGALFRLDTGTNGVLPIEISLSPTEITTGSNSALTWSSPSATACTATGVWTGTTVATAGAQSVTPTTAGIYTYGLSCSDTNSQGRYAYTAMVVRAPPLQPVDGGVSGSGAVSLAGLLLLAALLAARFIKETRSPCP